MEYAAEQADVMVHEETFPVGSALTSESLTITCNMAEASLVNLNNAIGYAGIPQTPRQHLNPPVMSVQTRFGD